MGEVSPRRPKWLPTTGPGNLNVPPERWGMSIQQWAAFIMGCRMCTEKWNELLADSNRKTLIDGEYKPYVNLYQLCDHFVKPWTRNCGNSIALLLNVSSPLKAECMISHAWGEGILETLGALLGRASVTGMSLKTAIWFCTFAQYQPGDMEGDCGPGVAAQLALNPFGKVIESNPRYGMLVIHTTCAELYGRLWCVFEVNEAQNSNVEPSAAMSMAYFLEAYWSDDGDKVESVDTASASCWSKDDEAMIKGKIEAGIGYDGLNSRIKEFRISSLARIANIMCQFTEWCHDTYPGWDEFRVLKMMADVATNHAGVFVGLHCLYIMASDTEDVAYLRQLMQEARICVFEDYGNGDNESMMIAGADGELVATPPPGFDPAKRSDDWDTIRRMMTDDDFLHEALLDLTRFPQPVGILEMGAGGNDVGM
eukprot:TRINITY_DN5846_c0_g2_i2.p1 TRINITY_DN5846_c0_g2~~TRINITY_DN5846_c0_g2_i2.p1  ORF type:complete len:424 (-),score=46.78 TRINITY_DN5846_c0_g2_i2:428-1699(-)